MKKRARKFFRSDIFILSAYVALTFAFTYPLIANVGSHLPGMGDNWQFYWLFWWFKHATVDLQTNPYYTDYIYYPIGDSLTHFPSMPINSFLSVPIQMGIGTVLTYNLYFLMSFAISAFGIYMLAKHFTGDRAASFFAGVAFAFSPQRIGFAAGFLNLMNVQFLPFYILFLVKFFETRKTRHAVISAVFFVLTSLNSWYIMVLAFVFSLLFAIWKWDATLKFLSNGNIDKVAIFALICFICLFPFVFPLFQAGEQSLLDSDIQHADIAAYILPSVTNPFFQGFSSQFLGRLIGNQCDMNLYIGISILSLSLYSMFRCGRKYANFWKLSLIFFFLWSLGPTIMFLGTDTGIVPPLYFMSKIPVLKYVTRLPVVSIMFFLSASVLSAYAISDISGRLRPNYYRLFLLAIFSILIFEFFSIPLYITEVDVPQFYFDIAEDSETYAILELPFGECPGSTCTDPHYSNFTYPFYMYYQTVHGKKIFGGYLARKTPVDVVRFTETTPFLKELKSPEKYNELPETNVSLFILNNLNVRYAILHRTFHWYAPTTAVGQDYIRIQRDYFNSASAILNSTLGDTIFYADEMIVVYEVPELPE